MSGAPRGRVACVSIHAPAEGATRHGRTFAAAWRVSIHAPAEGATREFAERSIFPESFNPRARGGRDNPRCAKLTTRPRFNPRARGGRDARPCKTG